MLRFCDSRVFPIKYFLGIICDSGEMERILHNFYSCCRDESGASAVEYAFVAFLISTVAIVAITEIGGQVSGMYGSVNEGFKGNQ